MATATNGTSGGARSEAPERAGLVLLAADPGRRGRQPQPVGRERRAPLDRPGVRPSQTALNLIAVGYSLGLAASVLYLGALGDRYGRKLMLILGRRALGPGVPARGVRTDRQVLFVARMLGGLSAGMALPDHPRPDHRPVVRPGRTRSIALWSAIGGAITRSARSPRAPCSSTSGGARSSCDPAAGRRRARAWRSRSCPAHVNETTDPVDNLGGILSVVMVVGVGPGDQLRRGPGRRHVALGLAGVAVAGVGAFVIRQRRAPNPLYDLSRRAADLLGRRLRRDHRVRLADGRGVRRAAVPAERARVLHVEAGAAILPAAL